MEDVADNKFDEFAVSKTVAPSIIAKAGRIQQLFGVQVTAGLVDHTSGTQWITLFAGTNASRQATKEYTKAIGEPDERASVDIPGKYFEYMSSDRLRDKLEAHHHVLLEFDSIRNMVSIRGSSLNVTLAMSIIEDMICQLEQKLAPSEDRGASAQEDEKVADVEEGARAADVRVGAKETNVGESVQGGKERELDDWVMVNTKKRRSAASDRLNERLREAMTGHGGLSMEDYEHALLQPEVVKRVMLQSLLEVSPLALQSAAACASECSVDEETIPKETVDLTYDDNEIVSPPRKLYHPTQHSTLRQTIQRPCIPPPLPPITQATTPPLPSTGQMTPYSSTSQMTHFSPTAQTVQPLPSNSQATPPLLPTSKTPPFPTTLSTTSGSQLQDLDIAVLEVGAASAPSPHRLDTERRILLAVGIASGYTEAEVDCVLNTFGATLSSRQLLMELESNRRRHSSAGAQKVASQPLLNQDFSDYVSSLDNGDNKANKPSRDELLRQSEHRMQVLTEAMSSGQKSPVDAMPSWQETASGVPPHLLHLAQAKPVVNLLKKPKQFQNSTTHYQQQPQAQQPYPSASSGMHPSQQEVAISTQTARPVPGTQAVGMAHWPRPYPPYGRQCRHIVIDGSNVAMAHGNNRVFSCMGIKIVVDWFLARKHKKMHVFVPQWRKKNPNLQTPRMVNQEILFSLENKGIVSFTPSRQLRDRTVAAYDDRFIVRLAAETEGVIVSNDNYRDLMMESEEWRKIIEERLLMFTMVGDIFMPPDDPLGQDGPPLWEFLTKPDDTFGIQKRGKNYNRWSNSQTRPPPSSSVPLRQIQREQQFVPSAASMPLPTPGNFLGGAQPPSHCGSLLPHSGAPLGHSARLPPPLEHPQAPHARAQGGTPPIQDVGGTSNVRTPDETDRALLELLKIFPHSEPTIKRILNNHQRERDINKLSTYMLDLL